MTDSFDHGLGERQLRTLRRIFSPYASLIDRVVVFGSRATGRYRPASDIDLAVFGQVEERDISAMASSFVESDLPITVDVLAYDRLEHQGLRGHIDRVGKTLFVRWDLQQPPSRPLPPRSDQDRTAGLPTPFILRELGRGLGVDDVGALHGLSREQVLAAVTLAAEQLAGLDGSIIAPGSQP